LRNPILQNRRIYHAIFLIFVLLISSPALSNEVKKVAICPFEMRAAQDLGYLQDGIFDMLYTRISDSGKVEVLERETVEEIIDSSRQSGKLKGTINEKKARALGQLMGADYILFGSVSIFGQSVSLDGSMVDLKGDKPTLTFFKQSDKMGDVIPMVNTFAGDVNVKVFNRTIDNELYTPEARKLIASGAIKNTGQSNLLYDSGFVNLQQNNINAGPGFQTHLKFDGQINAMATGDLNNDGTTQVVTATDYEIFIYKLKGKKLVQDKKLDFSSDNRIIALDIADINNNSYPEIFVTSLNIHRNGLQSLVLEYNGTGYITLIDDESYYYRVAPGEMSSSKILMGQRSSKHPFKGNVYAMAVSGGEYTRDRQIKMPPNTSVLSFARGVVTAEGGTESIFLNENGYLLVASEAGRIEWKGNNKFGGIGHFLNLAKDINGPIAEPVYLNPRIQFYDFGEDGKSEIITIRNEETAGGIGRYKRFKKGNIEILSWDGIALSPVFRTRSVQGWISDFAIADINGDKEEEMVVAVCSPSKFLGAGKSQSSNIISYKIKGIFKK